jgi:hypothetical protein
VSRQRLRVKNTELDNLISNLRGEVGEIITSWILLRHMMARERELKSDDIAKDLVNQNLAFVGMLTNKLSDEIVSRLSELAEPKIGRLTFHFAAAKLAKLNDEVKRFNTFISGRGFQDKRNYDISHKELPEEWSKHKHIHIPYRILRRAIGQAVRLMKLIDGVVLGPAAKHLWREMRKKRYLLMNPARAAYMMLPYLNLSREVRGQIVTEEIADGRQVWSEMTTKIDGRETEIPACQQWGAILLGGRMMVLDHYPLRELKSINLPAPEAGGTDRSLVGATPITAERKITAKYRVTSTSADRISFTPVQRQHKWNDGTVTDLVDIHVNLDNRVGQGLGNMNIGDEKEFSLNVTVLVGYQVLPAPTTPAEHRRHGPGIDGTTLG